MKKIFLILICAIGLQGLRAQSADFLMNSNAINTLGKTYVDNFQVLNKYFNATWDNFKQQRAGSLTTDQLFAQAFAEWNTVVGTNLPKYDISIAKKNLTDLNAKPVTIPPGCYSIPNTSQTLQDQIKSMLEGINKLSDVSKLDVFLLPYAQFAAGPKLNPYEKEVLSNLIVTLYTSYVIMVKTSTLTDKGSWPCWKCLVSGVKCGLMMVGGAAAGALAGSAAGTVTLPVVGTVAGGVLGAVGGAAAGLGNCL